MRELKEITIEILQRCNSNCIYCSSLSTKKDTYEIPIQKIKEIVSFAKTKKSEIISLSGGEPLLKDDIVDIVKYIQGLDLESNIYTSGNVDMTSFINQIKKDIFLKNSIQFTFNYNSSDGEIFSNIVNCENFSLNNINKNIKLCLDEGFVVNVHIVPNNLNVNTIFSTCKYLKSIGVKQVSLLRMVYQGRAELNRELLEIKDLNILENEIKKVKDLLVDNLFNLKLGKPFNKYSHRKMYCNDSFCRAGYDKLVFKYDGTVLPCETFKEAPNKDKYVLGDIYEDDLDVIWHNYHEAKDLKELTNSINPFISCERCPVQSLYN